MADTLTHLINGEKLGGDAPTGESINPSNLDDVDARFDAQSRRARAVIEKRKSG